MVLVRKLLGLCSGFKKRAHSAGVRVSETNSEATTPTVTTTAKERIKMPIMPSMKITVAKIQTRVREAASTANTTPVVPLMAASMGSVVPCSYSRCTFSSTTMASSTTTPMSNSRPLMVSMLKV